jgi:hypothetical protein
MRCLVIQNFPRAVVEEIPDRLNVLDGHVLKTTTLWEILANQAVGVLVQASFPEGVGMCKKYRCIQFFAIVSCPANSLPLPAVMVKTLSLQGLSKLIVTVVTPSACLLSTF